MTSQVNAIISYLEFAHYVMVMPFFNVMILFRPFLLLKELLMSVVNHLQDRRIRWLVIKSV